mgnify:CR=1 FL=1
MKYDSPFVEMECCQLTKDGQAACGDNFQWQRLENENRNIAVLSDGLGSGIKANLLATLTTTMAMKFIRSNMDILQSAETIMDTLPVCEIRKIIIIKIKCIIIVYIAVKLDVTINLHTCSGWDELTDNYVLLHTDKWINLALDCSLSKNLCGLLE